MTDLLIPGLTLICGLAAALPGARRGRTLGDADAGNAQTNGYAEGRVHRHGSDLLVHDMEIELALRSSISAVRRQTVQP